MPSTNKHSITISLPPGMSACPSTSSKPSSPTAACSSGTSQGPQSGGGSFTISLAADQYSLAPGNYALITATTNIDVGPTPYYIEIFNITLSERIAYCGTGTTCQTYATEPAAATDFFIAYVSNDDPTNPPGNIQATAGQIYIIWFGITLSAENSTVGVGSDATFIANTNADVSQDGYYIEVFDQSSQTLVGWCNSGTTCYVFVSLPNVTTDNFMAFISNYDTNDPPANIQAQSNQVSVSWQPWSISLASDQNALAPGATTTLTATTNYDVGPSPYWIVIVDASANTVPGICAAGTNCQVTAMQPNPTSDNFFAYVAGYTTTLPVPNVQATSNQVNITWLSIALTTNAASAATGNNVTLTTTANTDIGPTPFDMTVFDQGTGVLVGACGYGTNCQFTFTESSAGTHTFIAYISGFSASNPPPNIQATSSTANIFWFLWGVDTSTSLSSTFYNSIVQTYGTPNFVGRYIGDIHTSVGSNPGQYTWKDLTNSDITTAHTNNLAILPVYFNFPTSAVNGKTAGQNTAKEAIIFAQRNPIAPIPQGTAIFVDIEQTSGVQPDAAFIKAWYDTFNNKLTYTSPYDKKQYTYQPGYYKAGYYANTGLSSNFNGPFCTAVSQETQIALNSYIWTTQFDSGRTARVVAPGYNAISISCDSQTPSALQYGIRGNGPPPNVDTDEALSNLPLWHP